MLYPKLQAVTPLDDYMLALVFSNGVKRIYDIKPNLTHKFYKQLNDVELFKRVKVTDGEIESPLSDDYSFFKCDISAAFLI